jgi:hypothetical protein
MVGLLLQGGVTYRLFALPIRFHHRKSANNWKTLRVGRETSKEHALETRIGLSTGHVTSPSWRHLLPISAPGARRDFQKR